MEEWKDIVGYEGHYQISSDGRLRSVERKVKHKTLFNGQTKHSRILKLSISKGTAVEFDTPRKAFAALIDKVSGRGTWDRNPWVVVYEFELVK